MTWTELETSTYQHHVIQHVVGATVLGWFIAEDAVHFVLDVGLLWTVYVNAEMNLMALFVAIQDLEGEDVTHDDVISLAADADLLNSQGREATGLKRFTAAPFECLITSVEFFAANSDRRIVVNGEQAKIEVITSLQTVEVSIVSHPPHG